MAINTNRALVELSVKILNDKKCIRGRLKGKSMNPIISNNEIITIKPVSADDIMVGDIIAFKSNLIVTHRLIRKYRNGDKRIIVTKGDSSRDFDIPTKGENILGRLISIEKHNGVVINLETRTWRIINYIIAIYSLSTGLLYQNLCSIKRTLLKNRNNRFINLTSKILRFSIFIPPKVFIYFISVAQKLKSKLKT